MAKVKRKPMEEPEIEDLVVASPERSLDKGVDGNAKDVLRVDAAGMHSASAHDVDLKRVRDARDKLLVWYDDHRRKLPWRGDPPPYIATATHTKQTSAATIKRTAMDAFVVRQRLKEPQSEIVKSEDPKAREASTSGIAHPVATRKVSPYETWVSEIMLQQTRVDTVVDYFLRWIDAFPTVHELACASDEQVNALWAGLGYYRRARMLHAGAKYVVENYDGVLPSSTEQLLSIPGIGPYTAGAISSIAFGNREPLVDGNVIRVVARMRAVGADPKNKRLIDYSWKTARELVEDCDRPGELNQALMELGATVCTAQNPQCGSCPVRLSCIGYEEFQNKEKKRIIAASDDAAACTLCDVSRYDEWKGSNNQYEVTRYPLKAKKGESKNEVICVAVISHHDEGTVDASNTDAWQFLMTKRPSGGLLAGQWEFVHSKVRDGDKIPSHSQRKTHIKPKLLELFGGQNAKLFTATNKTVERRDLGDLVHIFSHVKHHMGIEHLHFATPPPLAVTVEADAANVRWMTVGDMHQLGITTGVKKILQLVFKGADSGKSSDAARKTGSKRSATSSSSVSITKATPKKNPVESPPETSRSRPTRTASHVTDSSASAAPKRLKTIRSFFKK